uniref:Ovule protein n=1 Tax=Anisakis simplex TaxID=6269 RepID=A0A0M3J8P8_ANISI
LPSSFSCCPNRLPQQTGDRFKKMSYLRPSDGTNGNLSTAERSITMTLVGSAASIRKAPQQNSHSNAHSQNNHHIKNDRNDYLSPSIW